MSSTVINEFGKKLRILRLQRGLTLKELAPLLGHASHSYLSELEAGKKTPTAELVLGVSLFFNVTTDSLLKDALELSNQKSVLKGNHMSLAFVDRSPTVGEVEKIRLLLSTYQDGTGMLALEDGKTLPGWRDFERAVALALMGKASESKEIFDVVLSRADATPAAMKYGLSCKMRSELNRIDRDGRVTIEVSNSAGKFWDHLASRGINQSNYKSRPEEVGHALIEVVNAWHQAESNATGGSIDLAKSSYLILSWNRAGFYQLHQFSMNIVDAAALRWHVPTKQVKGEQTVGRRINGDDERGTRVEWYGESGGQLKFYPFATEAIWQSERFQLEPLPGTEHGILNKVAAYFPDKWQTACENTI